MNICFSVFPFFFDFFISYIDPNAGGFLYQVLFPIVAGILGLLVILWRRLIYLWKKVLYFPKKVKRFLRK